MIRTLVVDDVEQNAVMLRALLENYNHRVIFASNGRDAIEIVNSQSFDLIISDIQMPNIDGFEFCKYLKSNQKTQNIPFIFYTATFMDYESKKYGLSLGADRYLLKPLEPKQLLATIENVFEEYRKKMGLHKEDIVFYEHELTTKEIHLMEQLENGLFLMEKKNKILKNLNNLIFDLLAADSLQGYFEVLLKSVHKYFQSDKVLITVLKDGEFVTVLNNDVPMTLKIVLLKYATESKVLMDFSEHIHISQDSNLGKAQMPLKISGSYCFLPFASENQSGIVILISETNYVYDFAEYYFDNLKPIINKTLRKY